MSRSTAWKGWYQECVLWLDLQARYCFILCCTSISAEPAVLRITKLPWNNADGSQIVAGVGNRVLVYDAVDGDLLHALKGHKVLPSFNCCHMQCVWYTNCNWDCRIQCTVWHTVITGKGLPLEVQTTQSSSGQARYHGCHNVSLVPAMQDMHLPCMYLSCRLRVFSSIPTMIQFKLLHTTQSQHSWPVWQHQMWVCGLQSKSP